MKKALVDICYREEMANKQKKFDADIHKLGKDDLVLKKLNEAMKGSRYPTGGVQMDQGEYMKHKKKFAEFTENRTDMSFCHEMLKKMHSYDLCSGIKWTKVNYDRFGKFRLETQYQKIPRDSARLALLCLCSLINKDLSDENTDRDGILVKLMCINEGLQMLDPEDYHRA